MDERSKFFYDLSIKFLDASEKAKKFSEQHQNRFNYYNSFVSTLALIISIVSLILQFCR